MRADSSLTDGRAADRGEPLIGAGLLELAKLLRDVAAEIPRFIAIKCDRWIIGQHRPLELYDAHGLVDALACEWCGPRKPWPCDHVVGAVERLNKLGARP